MTEKPSNTRYAALDNDDFSQLSEHDDLLQDYTFRPWRKSNIFFRGKVLIALGSVLLLASYTALCIGLTSLYWKGERLHGAGVVDTPLRPYIKYEPTEMHVGESTKDYTLMAHASDEVDAAWEDLLSDFFTEVPYSYVASVGRLDTSIPSTNGGFIATYTFMHQLHCLKRLHHSYWPDRYFPNTTADQKADILEHNLHCLQMMLTAIKCHADPVPETIRWVEESPYPFGNRSSKHECVNWEVLMKEMKRKRVDPFTPGLLVHPIYGPALGEGRGTVLDEGFRLKFVVGGTTVKVGGE